MADRKQTITEKIKLPKANWNLLSKIGLFVLVLSIMITIPILAIRAEYDTTSERVSRVEVGMTKQEVFEILGEEGWSNYDERGFQYGYNFKSPGGGKKTFWVTIKNDVVTDIATN